MKAICIKEPWASLIRSGQKTIETRTWNTNYRGDILLCASKSPKSEISGKAFARAIIYDCKPMTKEHEAAAMCEIYPNAKSWFLGHVVPIDSFEVKGQLGFFNVEIPKQPESKKKWVFKKSKLFEKLSSESLYKTEKTKPK